MMRRGKRPVGQIQIVVLGGVEVAILQVVFGMLREKLCGSAILTVQSQEAVCSFMSYILDSCTLYMSVS